MMVLHLIHLKNITYCIASVKKKERNERKNNDYSIMAAGKTFIVKSVIALLNHFSRYFEVFQRYYERNYQTTKQKQNKKKIV